MLTTVVGTTAFSTMQMNSQSKALQLGLGLVSVAAAVLASLQTFLNLGELAEKHKAAAGRYGSLRRRFELQFTQDADNLDVEMDQIRQQWDELDANTPNIAEAVYSAAVEPARKRAESLFSPMPVSMENTDIESPP